MSKKVRRLYSQFHPEHYQLTITPDPEAMTFTGQLTLRGTKIGRPSFRLTLHQNDLHISGAELQRIDRKGNALAVSVSRINRQQSLQEVRFHTADRLIAGQYELKVSFAGQITRHMEGIYPCFFRDKGKEKKLIATQFESHDARKVFPCIDEPEAKATFQLSLVTPSGQTVLSNTPIEKQSPLADHKILTRFESTPPMSTYLLAFAFGELGYHEATTKQGVTVRAYATPENVKLTDHALSVAVRCLDFFTDYFATPYPLKKLDLLALPDFSSGAMENWGLVTFRETTMLSDEASSSIETKQLVALVVCHELSHQWFGNLVTMRWWNDLWLNESFANLMEHRAVAELYPDWHVWELFVNNETTQAKRRDSLPGVQPVRMEVNHPDEISTLFDPSIVYAKGGSILYMLMCYIGENAFREGLCNYFKHFAYKNTSADDLWKELTATSQAEVAAFMDGWLNRPGYPLVEVNWQPNEPTLSLKQHRLLVGSGAQAIAEKPWQIPLVTTRTLDLRLLTAATASAVVSGDTNQPLIFNHDGQSYYVPVYRNPSHLEHIVAGIGRGELSPTDRQLLLDNYTLLQRSGEAATIDLLALLNAFAAESNETVWGAIAVALGEVRRLVEANDTPESSLNALITTLVMPTVTRLGWNDKKGDSAQTLRLRGLSLSLAIGAKAEIVVAEALQRFSSFKQPDDIPATIRPVVYYAGVRYGSDAEFEKLLALHNSATVADERDELASGLCSAQRATQHTILLGLLTSDHVRRQDLLHWFVWLLRNRYSREAAWEWMIEHWQWIEDELRGDKSYAFFARYAGSIFSHPEEYKKFVAFFDPLQDDVSLKRDIALAKQEMQSRIDWRHRNEAAVIAWLK